MVEAGEPLQDTHRGQILSALTTLVGLFAGLPSRVAKAVVTEQQHVEEVKKTKTLAARVKGETYEEIAASAGFDIQGDHLVCTACAARPSAAARGHGGHFGMWKTSRRVCEVKVDVAEHLKSASHAEACQAAANKAQELKDRRAAALNVMRVIYFLLKEADPHASFERLLVLLDRCGVSIGTLNHSRKLVAKVLSSFRNVFNKRLAAFLARPVAANPRSAAGWPLWVGRRTS